MTNFGPVIGPAAVLFYIGIPEEMPAPEAERRIFSAFTHAPGATLVFADGKWGEDPMERSVIATVVLAYGERLDSRNLSETLKVLMRQRAILVTVSKLDGVTLF